MELSVLMSVYARENADFFRLSLDSLCRQTLLPAQVVVVCDGGLPENLESVLSDFAGRLPLDVVRLPENLGLGRALQAGLAHCRHEYVCRMDSDDIALPDRFALQAAYLSAHPQTDVLGGQIAEFSHNPDAPERIRRVPLTHQDILHRAKFRNPFNHMTVCVRKTAVQAAGGWRHAPLYEDYDLWVRMAMADSIFANLPQILVLARTGAGMYARRGGIGYLKTEWNMLNTFRRIGFLSRREWLAGVCLRLPVRLLPENARQAAYRYFLRGKTNS